jgi:hypothetical protein
MLATMVYKFKRMAMNQIISRIMMITILAFALSSCSIFTNITKPPLSEIPSPDISKPIYFFDNDKIFSSVSLKSRKINDSTSKELYSGGINFTVLPLGERQTIPATISPFGNFLATHHNEVRLAEISLSSCNLEFGIYDLRRKEFVLDLTARENLDAHTYCVLWSYIDSGFFYVDADTLKKCYPSGTVTNLLYQKGLQSFAVSPSENNILISYDDTTKIFNIKEHTSHVISSTLDSRRGIHSITWSHDERYVAFGFRWRVFIYDINNGSLLEHKADDAVFDIEWLLDNSLVYVEGNVSTGTIETTEWFHICKLIPSTGAKTILHARVNQPPYIWLRLSPSGQLLLFAERKLNGNYEIKLMSTDGKQMNTICEGINPEWGK